MDFRERREFLDQREQRVARVQEDTTVKMEQEDPLDLRVAQDLILVTTDHEILYQAHQEKQDHAVTLGISAILDHLAWMAQLVEMGILDLTECQEQEVMLVTWAVLLL